GGAGGPGMLGGKALSAGPVRNEGEHLSRRVRAEPGEDFLEGEGRGKRGRLGRGGEDERRNEARGRVVYEMRYAGQSFELGVDEDPPGPVDPDALREAFAHMHEERYGYR